MAPVLLALITTASGLIGVVLGGWLTSRNQKRERQIRFFHEQLGEFYGPPAGNARGSACESGASVEN